MQTLLMGTGDGLKAQYFNSLDLNPNSLVLSRTDTVLNFDWGRGAPASSVNSDNFSVRWSGQIQAPTTGAFTFTTRSDDGIRLWVNGQKLIDAWNDHAPQYDSGTITLESGQKYNIQVEYYERGGGAVAQLNWSAPNLLQQVIPTAYLYSSTSIPMPTPVPTPTPTPTPTPMPTAIGNGLKAEYFNSRDLSARTFAFSRTDATLNFDWGSGAPNSLLNSDNFSVRWSGQIQAPTSGTFTFTTKSDDGVRLWVNGQRLIDAWTDHALQLDSGTITLQAGQKYDIQVEYYERGGSAIAQLYWSAPNLASQIIPTTYLYASTTITTPLTSGQFDVASVVEDMTLPHQGYPSGVPSNYSWYSTPEISYGNNMPQDWNAITSWGQVYVEQGWNPSADSNTRVQIWNQEAWYLSKLTGRWKLLQSVSQVDGASFREDFNNNITQLADVRDETNNGGGISIKTGNGWSYHFWTDRVTIEPSDIAGIYTQVQARLILADPNGIDDRASARYLVNDGADYWRSLTTPWASDWSNNGGVASGRFKFATNSWQNFSMTTLSATELSKNPPPIVNG
jgi:PA14 domain